MKSLMQITGAPSEKHLITALARYKVRRRARSRQIRRRSARPRADPPHPRPEVREDQGVEEAVQRLVGEGVKEQAQAIRTGRPAARRALAARIRP